MSSWRTIIITAMFMKKETWQDVEATKISLLPDWRSIGFEELKDLTNDELLDKKYLLYNSKDVFYPPPLVIYIWTKNNVYFSYQEGGGRDFDDTMWTIRSVPRNPF